MWVGFIFMKTGYSSLYGLPVSPLAGYVWIAIGILFIVFALCRKAPVVKEEFLICPKCEEAYRRSDVPDMKCPVCKVGLKNLKGYYHHKEEKEKE